jgi:Transposase and inactivated derivatives, IS30 family
MAAIIRAFQKGIQNGLSVDVIIKEYGLNISTATAYRYIDAHLIPAVKNIDLKRKTRYSPRSSSKPKIIPKNPDFLNGRRLTDFNDRMERDPSVNVWQMDTVIGKKGSEEKCLLTLLYTRTNLQLYFLLDSKTSENVVKVFDKIKDFLGPDLFKETFTVIKTDNGTEFSEPLLIETDPQTGEQLINIYFCEPRRSDQKGKCEKNHEQLREIIPPGLSMYTLSTHDINYASNMINNYPRRLFHYKSPLELSVLFLNEKVLQLNRLTSLRLDQVKLTPILH